MRFPGVYPDFFTAEVAKEYTQRATGEMQNPQSIPKSYLSKGYFLRYSACIPLRILRLKAHYRTYPPSSNHHTISTTYSPLQKVQVEH